MDRRSNKAPQLYCYRWFPFTEPGTFGKGHQPVMVTDAEKRLVPWTLGARLPGFSSRQTALASVGGRKVEPRTPDDRDAEEDALSADLERLVREQMPKAGPVVAKRRTA